MLSKRIYDLREEIARTRSDIVASQLDLHHLGELLTELESGLSREGTHQRRAAQSGPLVVLLVDDDVGLLKLLHHLVLNLGYGCEVAHSGIEALLRLQAGGVDVLMTDWQMPGMDGLELAREARKQWPLLPIIIATGNPPPPPSSDITRMVRKPFSLAELKNVLTEVLPGLVSVAPI